MEVAGYRAGQEALRHSRFGDFEREAALAVPDIQQNALIAGLACFRLDLSVAVDNPGFVLVEAVCQDIAGAHFGEDLCQAQGPGIGVDHEWQTCGIGDLACPLETFLSVVAHELRGQTDLDPHDVVAVLLAHPDGALDIGIPNVRELSHASAQHALRRDVEEGLDPRGAHVDHVLLEPRKGVGSGGPRVVDRRGAPGHAMGIGLDAVMRHAPVDVDVQIDQARRHQLACGLDDRFRLFLEDLLRDRGNASIGDGDVPGSVEALCGVDQRGPAYEEIVAGSHDSTSPDE